jgi:hypothetical protein
MQADAGSALDGLQGALLEHGSVRKLFNAAFYRGNDNAREEAISRA